ncbi:MAG: MFS transporter [Verrucomicrobiales bacterium]|nr:MFS transporter [Verrucomicrobiales bacterium]
MASSKYRERAFETEKMPPGIPYIVGNEAAERFSFYGMRALLAIFMTKYLWLMNDTPGAKMIAAEATEKQHWFILWVYFTPIIGALIADVFLGKYRTIIWLSLVYCAGHGALAFMGIEGSAEAWFVAGLALICIGSGGIKPCVSAHVGDQFGTKNRHLLTKVFNWFYWSINLGAFISSAMTPWLMQWWGPHLAFGVPGILMALATFVFWLGRRKFVHIPPAGKRAVREAFTADGVKAILKLSTIYVFVAVFWALFDQHSSSWVIQVDDMNRNFLGIEWLPSQIQALNPLLILTFIPLFTYIIYPAISKFFPLTPLRKMSIGFFVMFVAWLIVSFAQEQIDAGERPSFGWQALGYMLMTASEVMISIVCLEFSYTQAPKSMKSFIMALFLLAVAGGNLITALFNHYIQAPNTLKEADELAKAGQKPEVVMPGDVKVSYNDEFYRVAIDYPDKEVINEAAGKIDEWGGANANEVPAPDVAKTILGADLKDSFGNPVQYKRVSSRRARIFTLGADGKEGTGDDAGLAIEFSAPEKERKERWFDDLHPDEPWLDRRMKELGVADQPVQDDSNHFVGGQAKIEGAAYFWFFTWMILGAAVCFVIVAYFYKPKEYYHDDDIPEEMDVSDEEAAAEMR